MLTPKQNKNVIVVKEIVKIQDETTMGLGSYFLEWVKQSREYDMCRKMGINKND